MDNNLVLFILWLCCCAYRCAVNQSRATSLNFQSVLKAEPPSVYQIYCLVGLSIFYNTQQTDVADDYNIGELLTVSQPSCPLYH